MNFHFTFFKLGRWSDGPETMFQEQEIKDKMG